MIYRLIRRWHKRNRTRIERAVLRVRRIASRGGTRLGEDPTAVLCV